jgi:hypothetical protein
MAAAYGRSRGDGVGVGTRRRRRRCGRFPSLQRLRDRTDLLGFVGHCGHSERWFSCSDVPPFLYGAVQEGAHCYKNDRRPQSGCVMEVLPYRGDHIPYILPLDLHVSNLTRQSTHSQISVYDTLHHNS